MSVIAMALALGAAQERTAVTADGVTVLGRSEDEGDAAPGVAVLSADQLVTLSIRSLSDLADAIPNLSAIPAGVMAVEQYTIRGVYSPVGSPTVGLYLDDVPLAVRPSAFLGAADLATLDLAGVTVLRGSQGTASGASALAGIVRMRARRPDFDRSEVAGGGELGWTEHGAPTVGGHLAVGMPLGADVAMRTAVSLTREGGWIDRVGVNPRSDVNSVTTAAGRVTLAIRMGHWRLWPSVTVQRRRADDLPLSEEGGRALAQAFLRQQPGQDDLLLASVRLEGAVGAVAVAASASLLDRASRQAVDYSTVFGELVLGAAVPGLLVPGGSVSTIRARQRTATGELRLSSGEDGAPLAWVAGVQVSRARLHLVQAVDEPGIAALTGAYLGATVAEVFGAPLLGGTRSYQSTERDRESTIAGYGTLNWRPAARVTLSAGARAAAYRFGVESADAGPYAGTATPMPRRSARSSARLLPRLSAGWRPGESTEATVTWSRGYRPGGGNVPIAQSLCADDLAALGRSVAPLGYRGDGTETLDLGLRHEGARGRLTVAAFSTRWRDLAQQIDLPGCGFGYVDNLGRARVRGLEAEGRAAPFRALTLDAELGFADARFTRTIGGTGGPVIVSDGDRLPFVPRWTMRLGGAWARPIRDGAVTLGVDYRAASGFRRTPGPPAAGYIARVYRGPAVGRVDAQASVSRAGLSVALFVQNLLDARPSEYRSIDLVPVSGTPARLATIPPRSWGLRLQWRS